MFKGSCVALITPFRNGAVDERAFQDFVAWQIEQGTDVLVPCGTTGESPTLSHEEHNRVVELCIEVARGKVPVMAGAGSNSTAEAIALTRHAKKAGADAVLVVTPYYNKPTQEGHVPALQGDQRRRRHPDLHLQHPAAQRRRHERRDHGAARQAAEHRRRQGCDDGSRAAAAHAARDRPGFLPALGRGHHHGGVSGARRPWLHLGHRQCRAARSAPSCTTPGSAAISRRCSASTTAWRRCTTRCSARRAPAR